MRRKQMEEPLRVCSDCGRDLPQWAIRNQTRQCSRCQYLRKSPGVHKQAQQRYRKTEKGRAVSVESCRRYRQTDGWQAAWRRYRMTEAGKLGHLEGLRRWRASGKYAAWEHGCSLEDVQRCRTS